MSSDSAFSQSSQPPFPNYFELLKNIAQPFFAKSNSGAGFADHAAAMAFATLDVKEVERKIAELETVLVWLKAQVGVVELSVKTLEYQKSFLDGLAAAKGSTAGSAAGNTAGEMVSDEASAASPDVMQSIKDAISGAASNPSMNPALWAWNLLQQMPGGNAATGAPADAASPPKQRKTATKSGVQSMKSTTKTTAKKATQTRRKTA
jgi:hypothetical protein